MFSLFFSKRIEIFYNRSFISLCPLYKNMSRWRGQVGLKYTF